MRKFMPLLWMPVLVIAAFLLYRVKYEVQAIKSQITETSRALESEREALHVVAAEWAYLNRPERLQALADKYLATSSLTVEQIAEVEAIPFPKSTVADAKSDGNVKPASFNPEHLEE